MGRCLAAGVCSVAREMRVGSKTEAAFPRAMQISTSVLRSATRALHAQAPAQVPAWLVWGSPGPVQTCFLVNPWVPTCFCEPPTPLVTGGRRA